MNGGNIEIDSTCTAGGICIEGNASVVDNSIGTTVVNDTTTAATDNIFAKVKTIFKLLLS